jgi:hypothetical protein
MALFGLLRKKPEKVISWTAVAGRIAGMLLTMLNTDPKGLASPYSRVVLRKDGTVFIAADKRDLRQILGRGDLSYVFLRENQAALKAWVDELKVTDSPHFSKLQPKNLLRASHVYSFKA